jgi:hypothetical protein
MTLLYIIIGVILTVGFFFYLRDFVPLRPKEPGFEYVYVNDYGTVSELNEEDVEYLKTVFSPTDGARPYIKSRYQELTPDKKISGFILRKRVPKRIKIQPYKDRYEKRIIALAVSIASQTEPSDFKGISMIADGINHAVPSHKELQIATSWLINKGLINKVGNKYSLTEKGREDYSYAQLETKTLLKMWDNLEQKINNYA